MTCWRYTLQAENPSSLLKSLIKGRRVQQAYYYRLYLVHFSSFLFISDGKEVVFRAESADTLHQWAITEEDGFISVIIGAGSSAHFLGMLGSCLVNG